MRVAAMCLAALSGVSKDPFPLAFETREEYDDRCRFHGVLPLQDAEIERHRHNPSTPPLLHRGRKLLVKGEQ